MWGFVAYTMEVHHEKGQSENQLILNLIFKSFFLIQLVMFGWILFRKNHFFLVWDDLFGYDLFWCSHNLSLIHI